MDPNQHPKMFEATQTVIERFSEAGRTVELVSINFPERKAVFREAGRYDYTYIWGVSSFSGDVEWCAV